MTDLPAWCTPKCRILLAQIIAAKPEAWMLRPNEWANCRTPRFKGEAARQLRAIHEAAYTDAIDRFNAGEISREEAIDLVREDADQLIERMMREGFRAMPTAPALVQAPSRVSPSRPQAASIRIAGARR